MPLIEAKSEVSKLEEAIRLHQAGWWVVPQAGKRAVALGWDQHRLSENDLAAYLADGSLNIAVVLSRSECVDVECDGPEAERELVRLVGADGLRCPTWKSHRGKHRLFARPPGLPDRAKVEVRGIEVRIGNRPALSTVPPSVHETGTVYAWLPGLSLWDFEGEELPPLPIELVRLLKAAPQRRAVDGEAGEAGGIIPEGRRNDELFRHGCRLVRLGEGPLVVRDVLAVCNARQCRPPLPDAELASILRSVEETRVKQQALDPSRTVACRSWGEVREACKAALRWRQDIEDALAVALAVCLSTDQVGSQLFLQMIGAAGSAKTRICEALLSSHHCHALEHLTGFHSGWQGGDGEDFSLLSRVNHKTMITPEGDVLMSNPAVAQIMAQQRRIFDGSSGASYKNRKEDLKWEGLRTPWIIAGTPALLDLDQTKLGDRFLRVVIHPPTAEERAAIGKRVGHRAIADCRQMVNCAPTSILSEEMRVAYQTVGGYVDFLRDNAGSILAGVEVDDDELVSECLDLASFVSWFRAGPGRSLVKAEDHEASREEPTRLQEQLCRLSLCLGGVLGRSVDAEVIRIVRKVAIDTASGRMLDLGRAMLEHPQGISAAALAELVQRTPERIRGMLSFLRRLGGARVRRCKNEGTLLWRLSDELTALTGRVLGEGGAE